MDQSLHIFEQFKKTKSEKELTKNVDCFYPNVDGYGKYSSISVTFKLKSVKANHFLNPKKEW